MIFTCWGLFPGKVQTRPRVLVAVSVAAFKEISANGLDEQETAIHSRVARPSSRVRATQP